MSVEYSRTRMELCFMSYTLLRWRNDLIWILETNQKKAIQHVVPAICASSLRQRLQRGIELTWADLKKNFKGFMQPKLNVAEAFEKTMWVIHNQMPIKEASQVRKTLQPKINRKVTKSGALPRESKAKCNLQYASLKDAKLKAYTINLRSERA